VPEHREHRAPPPFPVCWRQHPALVGLLWMMKHLHDRVARGGADVADVLAWYDLFDRMVAMATTIATLTCADAVHSDVSVEPERAPLVMSSAPPLPGRPQPLTPAAPPPPEAWRERLVADGVD
jgi:hypothetical protein